MSNINVSVIIPTYRRKKLLENCLAAFVKISRDDFEIIIVNDDPQDNLQEVIPVDLEKKTTILNNIENCGPAFSRNFGAAKAKGELLAFIDDDVVVSENWIATGLRALAADEVVALVGKTILSAGQFPHPFWHFMINDKSGKYPSCNFWVKKRIFDKVGGFSSEFFDRRWNIFHHEDADLCFRLMAFGRIDFDPQLLVWHPRHSYSRRNPLKTAKKVFFDALLYEKHPKEYNILTTYCLGKLRFKRARTRFKIIDFFLFLIGLILLIFGQWWSGGSVLLVSLILIKLDLIRIIGLKNVFKKQIIMNWPAIFAMQFLALIYFNAFLVLGMFKAKKFFL